MSWNDITQAAAAITAAAGAGVAVLGLAQQLATVGERIGRSIWRSIGRTRQRWQRERKARQRRRS